MRLIWVIAMHMYIAEIKTQFISTDDGLLNQQSPEQLLAGNLIFSPYYQQTYPRISMPMYGFNPNPPSVAYSVPIQPIASATTFGTATTSFQNFPYQSAWTSNGSSILFANRKEYVGYVTEIKKRENVANSGGAVPAGIDSSSSSDVKPYLPDFMQGTSSDVQKKFREIVSNPDESFQQKQSKLDRLVSNLDSKNQELYDQHRRAKEMEEREKRERVHTIVANMSEKAQAVFAKLSAVLMNPEMKDADRMNRINDFYKNVNEDVKKEFEKRMHDLNYWRI